MQASLEDLSYRQGARIRKRHPLTEAATTPPNTTTSNAENEEGGAEAGTPEDAYCVRRTFLCEATRLRNPASVTQSTTEAHGGPYGGKGLNPRRVDVMSSPHTP